jgi:hypothetical protein
MFLGGGSEGSERTKSMSAILSHLDQTSCTWGNEVQSDQSSKTQFHTDDVRVHLGPHVPRAQSQVALCGSKCLVKLTNTMIA